MTENVKCSICGTYEALHANATHAFSPLEAQANIERQTSEAHGRNRIGDVKSGNAVEGPKSQAVRNGQNPLAEGSCRSVVFWEKEE